MDQIAILLEKMKKISDQKLNETFIGALKLTEEQKGIVDFVFWLCYMVEVDLESCIKKAWDISSGFFNKKANDTAMSMLINSLSGYRRENVELPNFLNSINGLEQADKTKIIEFIERNYKIKQIFTGVNDLPYFIDKIRIYEALLGKNDRTKLLWKINDIRNNLSHGKLDDLKYNNETLYLRTTKEKIIVDYFQTSLQSDFSKSIIWNSLSDEEKTEIKKMVMTTIKDNPTP